VWIPHCPGTNSNNSGLNPASPSFFRLFRTSRFERKNLMSDSLQQRILDAIQNPKNVGEMQNADSVGTVGSADCGDMLRMWVKFREDEAGRKVIDRATFQTFGCETAIAVASVATELIAGKTIEEALSLSGPDLAAPLGALPPMKIHCAQLVEGALRSALIPGTAGGGAPATTGAAAPAAPAKTTANGGTLLESFAAPTAPGRKVKIALKPQP
jgi:NifU-like protein involved in Fe-S cluster formation